MTEFTHLDDQGRVRMVDVAAKDVTHRVAIARGRIDMTADTLDRIFGQNVKRGTCLKRQESPG